MKTRPKPSLSLREIYESVVDDRNHIWSVEQQTTLSHVFVALAVGLEDVITQQNWTESDVDDLQEKMKCSHDNLEDFEDSITQSLARKANRELVSDIRKQLHSLIIGLADVESKVENIRERLDIISKWPIDGHERRLAKLEAKTGLESEYAGINRNSPVQPDRLEQIEKYPNMLKGTK